MKPFTSRFPSILAVLCLAALVLAGSGCGGDSTPPGVPDCRILSSGLDFGIVVRPLGAYPNSVVDVPVDVRSVLTVHTTGGQENLSGSVSYRITSDLPLPPAFRVPEAEGDPDFTLKPEETLTFTLEATVDARTTPGVHTGLLEFGETCGSVPFRIEVLGWDEPEPDFVNMWGQEGSEPGEFESPTDIAVDSQGHVYVLDVGNNRVDVFDADGNFITWWRILNERPIFNLLTGIAVDENDVVYVTDRGFEGFPRVNLFDTDGNRLQTWDRSRREPIFDRPGRLAVRDKYAFVADSLAGDVAVIHGDTNDFGVDVVRRIGKTGPENNELGSPKGVAIDNLGHVFVTDVKKHAVFVFSEEGEFLYRFGEQGSLPGQFNKPAGITYAGGFLYIADEMNVRVQKFTPDGVFQSLWGHPGYLEGAFYHPLGVVRGPDGSFYVVEQGHHRVQRFKYQTP